MGWLGVTIKLASLALSGLLALVGVAYTSDFGVQATVTAKQCGASGGIIGTPAGPGTVTVTTKLLGLEYTLRDVPPSQCAAIQTENFVTYHVRTQRTSLYQSEGGPCIYDSVGGVGGCPE